MTIDRHIIFIQMNIGIYHKYTKSLLLKDHNLTPSV